VLRPGNVVPRAGGITLDPIIAAIAVGAFVLYFAAARPFAKPEIYELL
jgi:hypothetical protein